MSPRERRNKILADAGIDVTQLDERTLKKLGRAMKIDDSFEDVRPGTYFQVKALLIYSWVAGWFDWAKTHDSMLGSLSLAPRADWLSDAHAGDPKFLTIAVAMNYLLLPFQSLIKCMFSSFVLFTSLTTVTYAWAVGAFAFVAPTTSGVLPGFLYSTLTALLSVATFLPGPFGPIFSFIVFPYTMIIFMKARQRVNSVKRNWNRAATVLDQIKVIVRSLFFLVPAGVLIVHMIKRLVKMYQNIHYRTKSGVDHSILVNYDENGTPVKFKESKKGAEILHTVNAFGTLVLIVIETLFPEEKALVDILRTNSAHAVLTKVYNTMSGFRDRSYEGRDDMKRQGCTCQAFARLETDARQELIYSELCIDPKHGEHIKTLPYSSGQLVGYIKTHADLIDKVTKFDDGLKLSNESNRVFWEVVGNYGNPYKITQEWAAFRMKHAPQIEDLLKGNLCHCGSTLKPIWITGNTCEISEAPKTDASSLFGFKCTDKTCEAIVRTYMMCKAHVHNRTPIPWRDTYLEETGDSFPVGELTFNTGDRPVVDVSTNYSVVQQHRHASCHACEYRKVSAICIDDVHAVMDEKGNIAEPDDHDVRNVVVRGWDKFKRVSAETFEKLWKVCEERPKSVAIVVIAVALLVFCSVIAVWRIKQGSKKIQEGKKGRNKPNRQRGGKKTFKKKSIRIGNKSVPAAVLYYLGQEVLGNSKITDEVIAERLKGYNFGVDEFNQYIDDFYERNSAGGMSYDSYFGDYERINGTDNDYLTWGQVVDDLRRDRPSYLDDYAFEEIVKAGNRRGDDEYDGDPDYIPYKVGRRFVDDLHRKYGIGSRGQNARDNTSNYAGHRRHRGKQADYDAFYEEEGRKQDLMSQQVKTLSITVNSQAQEIKKLMEIIKTMKSNESQPQSLPLPATPVTQTPSVPEAKVNVSPAVHKAVTGKKKVCNYVDNGVRCTNNTMFKSSRCVHHKKTGNSQQVNQVPPEPVEKVQEQQRPVQDAVTASVLVVAPRVSEAAQKGVKILPKEGPDTRLGMIHTDPVPTPDNFEMNFQVGKGGGAYADKVFAIFPYHVFERHATLYPCDYLGRPIMINAQTQLTLHKSDAIELGAHDCCMVELPKGFGAVKHCSYPALLAVTQDQRMLIVNRPEPGEHYPVNRKFSITQGLDYDKGEYIGKYSSTYTYCGGRITDDFDTSVTYGIHNGSRGADQGNCSTPSIVVYEALQGKY